MRMGRVRGCGGGGLEIEMRFQRNSLHFEFQPDAGIDCEANGNNIFPKIQVINQSMMAQ